MPSRGHPANLYYRWSKEFLEAGKKRLLGDTKREASGEFGYPVMIKASGGGGGRQDGRSYRAKRAPGRVICGVRSKRMEAKLGSPRKRTSTASRPGGDRDMIDLAWKPNWDETRRHFVDWWNRKGLVVGAWGGVPTDVPHEAVQRPGWASPSDEAFYTDAAARARRNHYVLSRCSYPLDMIPIADTMIGPGSLALCLGSEPTFTENTVWFGSTMERDEEPEKRRPIRFDPQNRWWKVHHETLCKSAELARGKYLVGCPDLVENIDILASLRGMARLFLDMSERPEWVSEKLREINRAYFEIYDCIYDVIKLEDGSSAFEAYKLWGPGKTAKVQCDSATMFSPAMFRQYVVPVLREQCSYLDYSMYHLDGNEQFGHLDALLEIEELDAIEWTPNANLPLGGDPQWYDLYRRILAAGKSVQVYLVWPREIVSLLAAIGPEGVYVLGVFREEAEVEKVLEGIDQFR